jgi:thioredoxin 1
VVHEALVDEVIDDVLATHPRVLLTFTAANCGPCLQVLPVLQEIASEAPDGLHVLVLDVDEHPQLKVRFSVKSLPTTLYFANGGLRSTVVGVRTKRQLLAATEA